MSEDTQGLSVDETKARLAFVAPDRQVFLGALSGLVYRPNEGNVVLALAQFHTNGTICIPDLLAGITREHEHFWMLVRVLVKGLALTAVPPGQFLKSLQCVAASFRGVIAMIDLTDAITAFCAARENVGAEFVDGCLALAESEDRAVLLGAGLIGFGKGHPTVGHTKGLALSAHADPTIRSPAVWSLGMFDYREHANLHKETETRFLALLKDEAPKVRATLAKSLVNILQVSPSREFADALLTLSQEDDPEVTAAVMVALALVADNKTDTEWWENALRSILERRMSTPRELRCLDHLFGQMEHADSEKVVPWIEHWAVHQDPKVNVAALDGTVNQLLTNQDVACRCVTRWFCHRSQVLQGLAAHLVQKHTERKHLAHHTPLMLDKTELEGIKTVDLCFVLRKIIGHCFAFEDDLVALVFSAMQKSDPTGEVQSLVVDSFASIIGINYPGTTAEFLRTIQDDHAKTVAKGIETALSKYFDPLRGLPLLREYQVSEVYRQKLTTIRNARNSEAMKKAGSESILKHIAHTVFVKHGRAFFSKIGDEAITGRKAALGRPTPFVHHSVSTEIPRESALDPVSLDWRLMCFRAEQRAGGWQ